MARYGTGVQIAPRSRSTVIIVEPTLGVESSQPAVDVPLGSTPGSENFIMREGALEPRPTLTLFNSSPAIMGAVPILGGMELTDVTGVRYPIVSGTTRMAVWNQGASGAWSVLSYVSSYGLNDPPSLSNTSYWDFTQIYFDTRDENVAVGAAGSYQTLYVTQSNTTVFSSLTGAPQALRVASFDNYLLAFNLRSGTSDYVQRVQWSDRGSMSSWTGGLSGFEDLLTMNGQGTRIMAQENRVVLFSDSEVWQGISAGIFPSIFQFQPLDQSVGCPYPWTAITTPLGIIFLSKSYQIYLLPKSGGPAVPIGGKVFRYLRTRIGNPERSWAAFDDTTNQYQLFYPIQGGSGYPQRAVYLNIENVGDASWAPQSFDLAGGTISLSRGYEVAQTLSSGTSWGGLGAAGLSWSQIGMSWAQLGGLGSNRAILAGTSGGTVTYFNSAGTADLAKDGSPVEVRAYWRSSALGGWEPERTKTLTQIRADYACDSSSSLTIRASQNQGASFDPGVTVSLPAASALSQVRADLYSNARYPMFEVSSVGQKYRLFRFYAEMRSGGR